MLDAFTTRTWFDAAGRALLTVSYLPGVLDDDLEDGGFIQTSSAIGALRRGSRALTGTVDELLGGLKTASLKHYTMSAYRSVAEAAVKQGMGDSFQRLMKDSAVAKLADVEKPGAIYGLMRAESLGWKRVGSGVSYDKGNHGFDFVFEDPKTGRLAVLETKSGRGLWSMERDRAADTGKLRGLSKDKSGLLQGTGEWIRDRAGKVKNSTSASAADKLLAKRLMSALDNKAVDSYASFGRSDELFKLDLRPLGRYNPANTTKVDWPPSGIKT